LKKHEDERLLNEIMNGETTLKTFFMSKRDKIQRITALQRTIESAGQDIDCLSLLHKIIVIQLIKGAI